VNREEYIDTLRHLRGAVRRKRPEKWRYKVGFSFTLMLQDTGLFWSRIS